MYGEPRTTRDVDMVVEVDATSLRSLFEWSVMSGSTRQLDDARGIVRVQGDRLDFDHLRSWADRLGVSATLDQVLGSSLYVGRLSHWRTS